MSSAGWRIVNHRSCQPMSLIHHDPPATLAATGGRRGIMAASPTRLLSLSAVLIVLSASASAAGTTPWTARTTDFGLTAVGTVDVAPNTPATDWNVLAVGLFCGTPKLGPQVSAGKIYFYLYGISADRSASGKPLFATVTADGTAADLTFG